MFTMEYIRRLIDLKTKTFPQIDTTNVNGLSQSQKNHRSTIQGIGIRPFRYEKWSKAYWVQVYL